MGLQGLELLWSGSEGFEIWKRGVVEIWLINLEFFSGLQGFWAILDFVSFGRHPYLMFQRLGASESAKDFGVEGSAGSGSGVQGCSR